MWCVLYGVMRADSLIVWDGDELSSGSDKSTVRWGSSRARYLDTYMC